MNTHDKVLLAGDLLVDAAKTYKSAKETLHKWPGFEVLTAEAPRRRAALLVSRL